MNRLPHPLRAVPFTDVQIRDGFWSPRQETNRTVTIPFAIKKCEETGRFDNFAKAARLMPGEFRGRYYDDSDVYKVIEGIAYSLATYPDPQLDAYLDRLIATIAAAQEPDGYLYTNRTIDPANVQPAAGPERWSRLKDSHELYNVGHLYEAAVAHFRATGKRSLLDVALKSAELILATFGPDKRRDPPGHQEIEIGLVKLYGVTGDRRYVDLAKFFLDQRGQSNSHTLYGAYAQDHAPVVEQREAVGHAVRALYMYSGMADVASLSGEAAYLDALEALWNDVVAKKLAITGGVGARHDGESFGDAYELPNHTSYNETCAAIANVFWNHRLFLLTGEAKYIDVLERTLYNGLIAGVSLSGDRFFYVNPLASDGVTPFNYGNTVGRAEWFACSCCPVNVVRLLASLGGYIYARSMTQPLVFVNLFIAGAATVPVEGVGRVTLTQHGDYPWDGALRISVAPEAGRGSFAVAVRIPCWASGRPVPTDLYRYDEAVHAPAVEVKVNNQAESVEMRDGYAVLHRDWNAGDEITINLPMPVRRVTAHPSVRENNGRHALERGPLVYCVEAQDNETGCCEQIVPAAEALQPLAAPGLLGGITVLHSADPPLTAIPYYAWAHRSTGRMAVWLPDIDRRPAAEG